MKKCRSFISFLIVLLIFSFLPSSLNTRGTGDETYKTLVYSNFENGKFDGWSALGGKADLSITDERAYNGNLSLTTANRVSTWAGPRLNITKYITGGQEYLFKAYVISNEAKEINVGMTAKYTDIDGRETYINMLTKTVGNEKWEYLEAKADFPKDIEDVVLYFETVDGFDDFSIDDVVIYGCTPRKAVYLENEKELEFDFENGIDGWSPRGDVNVDTTDVFSYSGTNSLCISEKNEILDTAMVRIDIVKPKVNYTYSAYVMSLDKKYGGERPYSIGVQYIVNGKEKNSIIKSKLLKNGTWSKISGDFILPDNAKNVYFYVIDDECEKEFENLKYYIDEVLIFDSTMSLRIQRRNLTLMIILSLIVVTIVFFTLKHFVKKNIETRAVIFKARLDSMTGAYNRNTFEIDCVRIEKDTDKVKKLYITACDVNFLKYINDNYGHDSGDKAIIRCAGVLLRSVGKKGTVYRIGGDEFVCITEIDMTKIINAELLKESADYKGYPFSAAVGTAHYDSELDSENVDIKTILARSDKAMYNHKIEIKKQFDFID